MDITPPKPTKHIVTKEDLPLRPDSPFELTLNQSLELERIKREVNQANPDDLKGMIVSLLFQLMIKNNICTALMKGQF